MTNFVDFATIPAIAAIVYTIIDIVKTAMGGDEKFKRFIPLIACGLGAVIGTVCFFCVPGVLETRTFSWLSSSAQQAVFLQQAPTRW